MQTTRSNLLDTDLDDLADYEREVELNAHAGRIERQWQQWLTEWLDDRRRRNFQTARAYRTALDEFTTWLRTFGRTLSTVRLLDLHMWGQQLTAQEYQPTTISQRLSAVMSFLRYVEEQLRALPLEDSDVIIIDYASGQPLLYPTRARELKRQSPKPYANAARLPKSAIQQMLRMINDETVTGARDKALLLAFLLTGWRPSEVLPLRINHLCEVNPGKYVALLPSREGAKLEPFGFPVRCYNAIVRYLELAGRSIPRSLDPSRLVDYIWQPLRPDTAANFPNVDPTSLRQDRFISATQATNVLRKRLGAAGIPNAESYNLRSLRHAFTEFYMLGEDEGVVAELSERLRHSSPVVTRLYVKALKESSGYSERLERAMGI